MVKRWATYNHQIRHNQAGSTHFLLIFLFKIFIQAQNIDCEKIFTQISESFSASVIH